MHRRSGRKVNPEYYIAVALLPDKELFSAQEISALRFDKKTQDRAYYRMSQAIYRFGERNGLTISPDNCEKNRWNEPLLENGKIRLKDRDKKLRWYGKTWKSKMCQEDWDAIQAYARSELLLTLMVIQEEKSANQSISVNEVLDIPKPRKWALWPWVGLMAIVGLFLVSMIGILAPREQFPPGARGYAEFVQHQSRPKSFDRIVHQRPDLENLKADFNNAQGVARSFEYYVLHEKPSLIYSRISLLQ